MSDSSSTKRDSRPSPVLGTIGWFVRNTISLLFVGFAVACIYNVYGVGPEVETMAKELACQGQPSPCSAQYTRAERTPWAHTFKMYSSASSGERPISCQRQYIFVGDYACQFKDGSSAPPNGTPSAVVKDAPASSGKAPITARPRSSGASVPTRFGPTPSATASAR